MMMYKAPAPALQTLADPGSPLTLPLLCSSHSKTISTDLQRKKGGRMRREHKYYDIMTSFREPFQR